MKFLIFNSFILISKKLEVLLSIFCGTKITLEWITPPPLFWNLHTPLICNWGEGFKLCWYLRITNGYVLAVLSICSFLWLLASTFKINILDISTWWGNLVWGQLEEGGAKQCDSVKRGTERSFSILNKSWISMRITRWKNYHIPLL